MVPPLPSSKLTCGHDARLVIDGGSLEEWARKHYSEEEIQAFANKVSNALKRQLRGENPTRSTK